MLISNERNKTLSTCNEVRKKTNFRSGLEVAIAAQLSEAKVPFTYEELHLQYKEVRNYTPDFQLNNGIIIEAKGFFDNADRAKMLRVKEQHPSLDIRFIFSNPNTKISKQTKTTYAIWCERNGFEYAKGKVPKEWLLCPQGL